jgi:hypothetical protein
MVITSKSFLKEFRKQVSEADVWPMVRAIGESISQAQAQNQDMLLGIVLTDEGVAVKRLAFDETSAEVFGMSVTEAGIATGAAYMDESGVVYQAGLTDAEGTTVQTGVLTSEGGVVVNENTPAGSDETTVDVYELTAEDTSDSAAAALPAAADEAPAEEASADDEKPAEDQA